MSYARYAFEMLASIAFTTFLHFSDVNYFRSTGDASSRPNQSLSHGCSSLAANRRYYEAASSTGKQDGQGRRGWLFLLASYDCDPHDQAILDNLVDNYVRANYSEVAIHELSTIKTQHAQHLLHSFRDSLQYARFKERLNASFLPTRGELPIGQTSVLFPTLLGQYDFLEHIPELGSGFHNGFVNATVEAYNELKEKLLGKFPDMSDTEINHQFFRWQMFRLEKDGQMWQGFTDQPSFTQLFRMFKGAAVDFLVSHGMNATVAREKVLSHQTVYWVSVHSNSSVHQPHMTEDSLVGGVYYVTVPPGSGDLELFDARGKSPILKSPTAVHNATSDPDDLSNLPMPPFHRSAVVHPSEGMLVLFPGWLVHQVLPSPSLDTDKHGYRISISFNLKGEWQDTAQHTVLQHTHTQERPREEGAERIGAKHGRFWGNWGTDEL
jgi:uncharacterized protein (TIGR02466 family)